MERKADVNSDLSIKVQVLNEEQMQTEIERMLNLIAGLIDKIEDEVCQNMKRLFFKQNSNEECNRNQKFLLQSNSMSTSLQESLITDSE